MLNAYNTEVINGLERVQEECDFLAFEVIGNYGKSDNGVIPRTNSTAEKFRVSSKTKIDPKMPTKIQRSG